MSGGSEFVPVPFWWRSYFCSFIILAFSDRRFALTTFRTTTFFHIITFVIWVNHIFSTLFSLIWTYRILQAQHLKLGIKLRHQLLWVKRRWAGLQLLLLTIVNENTFHVMTFTFLLFQIQSASRSSLSILHANCACIKILVINVNRIDLACVVDFASSWISLCLGALSSFNSINIIENLSFILLQYLLNLRHHLISLRITNRLDVILICSLAILCLIIIYGPSAPCSRRVFTAPLFILRLSHSVRIWPKISDVLRACLAISAGWMIGSTTCVSSGWGIFTLFTWIHVIQEQIVFINTFQLWNLLSAFKILVRIELISLVLILVGAVVFTWR